MWSGCGGVEGRVEMTRCSGAPAVSLQGPVLSVRWMKPDFLLPITPCTGVVSEIPMHHMHTRFHTYTHALSLSEKTHVNEL